jgi:hypothetical protein
VDRCSDVSVCCDSTALLKYRVLWTEWPSFSLVIGALAKLR